MSLLFWGAANEALLGRTLVGQSGLAGGTRTAVGRAAAAGALAGLFRIDQTLTGASAAATTVAGSPALLVARVYGQSAVLGVMDFAVDPPCCLDAAAVYVAGLADAAIYGPGLRAGALVC